MSDAELARTIMVGVSWLAASGMLVYLFLFAIGVLH
jgi:hypothetical protein